MSGTPTRLFFDLLLRKNLVTDVQSNWMLQFAWPTTSQFGVTCPRERLLTIRQLCFPKYLLNNFIIFKTLVSLKPKKL